MAPHLQRHAVFDLPHILNILSLCRDVSDAERRETQILHVGEPWLIGKVPQVVVIVEKAIETAVMHRELVQGPVADRPAMLTDGVPTRKVFAGGVPHVDALVETAAVARRVRAVQAVDIRSRLPVNAPSQCVMLAELDVPFECVQQVPIGFLNLLTFGQLHVGKREELQFTVHIVWDGNGRLLADSFERPEEKRPVGHDRTAHGPAELLPAERQFGPVADPCEVVLRRQGLIAFEEEPRAFEGIRAGLGHDVHRGAR